MFHVKRRPTRDLRGSVQRAHGSRAHRRSSARRGWSEGRDEETCGASSLARASALGRGGLNGTAPDARSVTRSLTLLGCYRATVTAYCPGTRCQAVDSRHPGSPCLPTSATQICCPRPGSPHDENPDSLSRRRRQRPTEKTERIHGFEDPRFGEGFGTIDVGGSALSPEPARGERMVRSARPIPVEEAGLMTPAPSRIGATSVERKVEGHGRETTGTGAWTGGSHPELARGRVDDIRRFLGCCRSYRWDRG